MSGEAIGQNGAILGSPEYWTRINQATSLGPMMVDSSGPNYVVSIKNIGQRAESAINAIYEDLQNNTKVITLIPSDQRLALANQVIALHNVCEFSGVASLKTSDCLSILNLSKSSFLQIQWYDISEINAALEKIRTCQYFLPSESVSLIKNSMTWGIDFVAGNDKKKKSFLNDIMQQHDKEFLQEVLNAYQNESNAPPKNMKGFEIGSTSYLRNIENNVFSGGVPFMLSAGFGIPNYLSVVQTSINQIADLLTNDIQKSIMDNNYITDELAHTLIFAEQELFSLGVNISIHAQVDKLTWFVGGDPFKIQRLQNKLNALGYGNLSEDGVYGVKTLQAWTQFLRDLEHGTVPTLCWVDALQSEVTGIRIGSTTNGARAGLHNAFVIGNHPYIRFDPTPNGVETAWVNGVKRRIDYPHINLDKVENSNWLYDQIQRKYNHYPLSDDAYNLLKDLRNTGKKVRIAGKLLLVGGIALDALEIGMAVNEDLHDVDGKLGKPLRLPLRA